MALATSYSLSITSLLGAVLIAIITFTILIFALKVTTTDDINFVIKSILKKSAPAPEEPNI
jgi:hypothetical protein